MVEVLPIKVLTDEDGQIFGSLNVALGKLHRFDIPVAPGVVVAAPNLKLKTVLEHFDFGSKEIFEQSLTLVKREISSLPIPQVLEKELKKQKKFLLNGEIYKSAKEVWLKLLAIWIEEIKKRLWKDGFYPGITESLDAQAVIFVKKPVSRGSVFFDPLQDDTVINVVEGKLHPNDLKKLDGIVRIGNKKLFLPHEYEWVVDGSLKLTGVKPYTPTVSSEIEAELVPVSPGKKEIKSTVKVLLDLSSGLVIEREADGIYIAAEKIFDLNTPRDSFEDMLFRLVESATTFPQAPVLFKLADKSEGMGKIRGTLRLLHQKNLLDPMLEALDFVRHKRRISNVHIVVPFVRGVEEFLQIKRELAVKKLGRKHSLGLWLEISVPENLINLEDYLVAGLDGVVLNMDELTAFINGYDSKEQEVAFYKNNVEGLISFLEDGIRLLHKAKVPFISLGSVGLNPSVLDFLVEKGVWGMIVERYEVPSAHDLIKQSEKRMILKRAA